MTPATHTLTYPHTPLASTSYLALLRTNPNFRNVWFGEIVSLFGDWFNLIASAALVAQLTGSGLAVGGLFVVRMLAPFFISPIAGVWADRYNRRALLLATDLARFVIVLGFLLVREPGDVWLLYTLTVLQLAVSGVFFPARNAILPDIVTEQEIGAANALSSATWSVMLSLGAALGGVVTGEWGIYPAFIIDAFSFLVSAWFIARLRYTHTPPAAASGGLRAALGQYVDGLRYLRHNSDIFFISLLKALLGLAIGGFEVARVVVAEQVFVIGEGGGTSLGLLYAVTGVGTGLGPIWARRFTGDRVRPLRWAIVLGFALAAAGLLLIVPLSSFGLVLLGSLLRSIGSGIVWVFSTQLLLQLVPNAVRGRVFSSDFAAQTLTSAITAGLAGWLLDQTGLGLAGLMLSMAALTAACAVGWALWTVRTAAQDTVNLAVE
jgi:MFS family permease